MLGEEFAQIKMPVHKTFSSGYARWRIENADFVPSIYMKYCQNYTRHVSC